VRGREHFRDPHALHAVLKLLAVDLVTVAQEIRGRGVVREGVDDLLGGPAGGRVFGYVEVDDAPAMVSEHDENEEYAQACGGHREEIEGDQVPNMIGEECPPGLGRRGGPPWKQPGDGAFGHVDAELEKLTMNSRGAPERVRGGHAHDQGPNLGVDGRAAGGPAGELGPVLAETTPLPPQDSAGGDDDERLLPPGPDPGQRDPEEAVRRTKLGSRRASLVDGELVAQGEILESELPVAAAQEGEEPNEVEQDGDHRARILSRSELADQPLACRTEFWRRTGVAAATYRYPSSQAPGLGIRA